MPYPRTLDPLRETVVDLLDAEGYSPEDVAEAYGTHVNSVLAVYRQQTGHGFKRIWSFTCDQCGKEFESKTGKARYRRFKFCSGRCQARHKRGTPQTRICRWCGKEFPTERGKLYCKPECYREAKSDRGYLAKIGWHDDDNR